MSNARSVEGQLRTDGAKLPAKLQPAKSVVCGFRRTDSVSRPRPGPANGRPIFLPDSQHLKREPN